MSLPQCADEGLGEREGGDVSRLAEGPVVRGERPSQGALSQGQHKVDTPEEGHHVVDLQVEQVPLQQALCVVLDKDAPRRRTELVGGGVEGLREIEKEER